MSAATAVGAEPGDEPLDVAVKSQALPEHITQSSPCLPPPHPHQVPRSWVWHASGDPYAGPVHSWRWAADSALLLTVRV